MTEPHSGTDAGSQLAGANAKGTPRRRTGSHESCATLSSGAQRGACGVALLSALLALSSCASRAGLEDRWTSSTSTSLEDGEERRALCRSLYSLDLWEELPLERPAPLVQPPFLRWPGWLQEQWLFAESEPNAASRVDWWIVHWVRSIASFLAYAVLAVLSLRIALAIPMPGTPPSARFARRHTSRVRHGG